MIAVIIGKMWQQETMEVRDYFTEKSEEAKRRHKEEHPDYTYQPRKPSEKKRRMTKKKAAMLQLSASSPQSVANSSSSVVASQQVQLPLRTNFGSLLSAQGIFGQNTSATQSLTAHKNLPTGSAVEGAQSHEFGISQDCVTKASDASPFAQNINLPFQQVFNFSSFEDLENYMMSPESAFTKQQRLLEEQLALSKSQDMFGVFDRRLDEVNTSFMDEFVDIPGDDELPDDPFGLAL